MDRKIKTELLLGLYMGFIWNLAAAALLNNPFESSTRTWFVVLGGVNELGGVVLIASPELGPRLRLLLRALGTRLRSVVARVQRFLRLRRNVYIDGGTATAVARVSGDVRVEHGPPQGADTARILRWLLEELKRVEDHVHTIETRVAELPGEWRTDIAEARSELEGLSRELVKGVAEANLALRLLGVGYVVVGLFLSVVGNLV